MKNTKENLHVNSEVRNIINGINLKLSNYDKCRLCAFSAEALNEANRLLILNKNASNPFGYLFSCAEVYHRSIEIQPDYGLAERLMKRYRPPLEDKENMYAKDDTTPLQYREFFSTIQPATAKDWTDQGKLAEHIREADSMKRLASCGIDPIAYMVACATRASRK